MTAGLHKVRVCFPRETTERKAVKDVIVSGVIAASYLIQSPKSCLFIY